MSLGNLSLPSIQNLSHQESISCSGGGGRIKTTPPLIARVFIFSPEGIFMAYF